MRWQDKILAVAILLVLFALSACGAGPEFSPTSEKGEDLPGSSGSASSASSSSSNSSGGALSLLAFAQPNAKNDVREGNPFKVIITTFEDVDYIDLYLDGELIRREDTAPWDWSPEKGDQNLAGLSAGDYQLSAIASTLTGNILEISLDLEVTPAASSIRGISLINASNNTRFPAFDPMDTTASTRINQDALAVSDLSLIADYEGDVDSVRFSLNGNPDFHIDNDEPYTFSTFPSAWNLVPGDYQITATPYSEDNAGGHFGLSKAVQFRLEQASLSVDQSALSFISSVDSTAETATTLRISNAGNASGVFAFSAIPDWISVSQLQGTIAAGAFVEVTLVASACDRERDELGTLPLRLAGGRPDIELSLRRVCTSRVEFDFQLERFYFNQAVPAQDSQAGSEGEFIELIADRPGLARAFVTRNNKDVDTLPEVVLFYRTADGQSGSHVFGEQPVSIPSAVDEGERNASFNEFLPDDFFQSGTEFYVEVDPNNRIAEVLENNNRYPETGYLPLNIVRVPTFEIVFVPVIVAGENSRDPNLTAGLIRQLMRDSEALLPLADYSFSIQSQPLVYTGADWVDALRLINNIRISGDRAKFYHGIVDSRIDNSNTSGIARIGGRAALSRVDAETIAHEFGHNLDLLHTDCGGPASPERNYPYANARTGNWGYHILEDILLAQDNADFMSYCGPVWIGSFNFHKMLRERAPARQALRVNKTRATAMVDPFMITGEIKGNVAVIEDILKVDGHFESILDEQAYKIELVAGNGNVIYQASFTPFPVDHANTLQFDIPLPKALLANDTDEIRLLRNDVILLQEKGYAGNKKVLSKSDAQVTVTRLDNKRVEIRWSANAQSALWVTDLVTNNILTIDKTGRVIVYTANNRLELKTIEKGRERRRVVELK